MTEVSSWILLDHRVTEVDEDMVRYQHTSDLAQNRVLGESVLYIVRWSSRYYFVAGGAVPQPEKVRPFPDSKDL